jgi:hypothetical protein
MTHLDAIRQDYAPESIMEFGSGEGVTHKVLHPKRYFGVDIAPRWLPHAGEVIERDVFSLRPSELPPGPWDLVYCDAHDGVDSPILYEITEQQVKLALAVSSRLIGVDDCWVPKIARAAVDFLGEPIRRYEMPTNSWIWERRGLV